MSSQPGPKRHVEKEWEKTANEVSNKLGIQRSLGIIDTDQLFDAIKAKDTETHRLMWEYLDAYEKYSMYLNKLSHETVPDYYKLEEDMNDKRRVFYKHLYSK